MRRSEGAGFTLIELLIVIAILGILAIGLIVALDPVEQINRATDSNTLTTARAFISATSQFQSNKQYSAACSDSACTTFSDSLGADSVPLATVNMVNASLYSAGSAHDPTNFISHPQSAGIFVSLTNITPAREAMFVICWKPQSKALKSAADVDNPNTTVFNDTGAMQTASACPADNSNHCYRCLRQ